ncbi:hypothetical protein GLOTRDRAFT_101525, partial [Gloeophyllum trabeum ATCC 11539]
FARYEIAEVDEQNGHNSYQGPLIPKPRGTAGRSSAKGGYNLQDAMGLKNDPGRYKRLRVRAL